MFDIGFTELLLCLVVALVVIGPEQLPGAVRSVSLWLGRLKRSLRDTRTEIERQIGADDIRRQLHNEEIMQRIEESKKTLLESIDASTNWTPHKELPDHSHTDQAQTEQTNSTSDKNNPVPTNTTTAVAPNKEH